MLEKIWILWNKLPGNREDYTLILSKADFEQYLSKCEELLGNSYPLAISGISDNFEGCSILIVDCNCKTPRFEKFLCD